MEHKGGIEKDLTEGKKQTMFKHKKWELFDISLVTSTHKSRLCSQKLILDLSSSLVDMIEQVDAYVRQCSVALMRSQTSKK